MGVESDLLLNLLSSVTSQAGASISPFVGGDCHKGYRDFWVREGLAQTQFLIQPPSSSRCSGDPMICLAWV